LVSVGLGWLLRVSEKILKDCMTKIFGEEEYSGDNGVNFDTVKIILNGEDGTSFTDHVCLKVEL